jgi:hypothetical protein
MCQPQKLLYHRGSRRSKRVSSSSHQNIYGHRARIGYTCPPLSAEVFPYEFYKLAPDGVTLVITTLTVIDRSKSEVDAAYEMSMRAARELAAAGVDIVFLGGVPVNLSRGTANAQEMLRALATELGVKVSSSVAAQEKAAKALGCRKVVVAHPYAAKEDAGSSATPSATAARCWACSAMAPSSINSAVFPQTRRSTWGANYCAGIRRPRRSSFRRRTGR